MRAYEGLFIFTPRETPDARKKQLETLEKLIKKFEGSVTRQGEGVEKPLGYALKKFKEGCFVTVEFEMPSLKMTEFRNVLELQEGLLKFMLTVQNAKGLEPSTGRGQVTQDKPAQKTAT